MFLSSFSFASSSSDASSTDIQRQSGSSLQCAAEALIARARAPLEITWRAESVALDEFSCGRINGSLSIRWIDQYDSAASSGTKSYFIYLFI